MPFLIAIFGIAVAIALLVFGINIIAINVNDILAVGANFWNVFWIASVAFGGKIASAMLTAIFE